MAKLNACSASIHVTPSGKGLPSACDQVGRLANGITSRAMPSSAVATLVESSTCNPHTVILHLRFHLGEALLASNPCLIYHLVANVWPGVASAGGRFFSCASSSSCANASLVTTFLILYCS